MIMVAVVVPLPKNQDRQCMSSTWFHEILSGERIALIFGRKVSQHVVDLSIVWKGVEEVAKKAPRG